MSPFVCVGRSKNFGAANESVYYTDFAVKSFRVYLCMMPLAMVNKGTFIYLQALGKAMRSVIVSLTREVIFGVFLPIILLLSARKAEDIHYGLLLCKHYFFFVFFHVVIAHKVQHAVGGKKGQFAFDGMAVFFCL